MLEYACEVWDPYVRKLHWKVYSDAHCILFTRATEDRIRCPLFTTDILPLLPLRRKKEKKKRLKLFYGVINNVALVNKHQVTRNKHGRHVKEKFNKECFRYSFF